MANQRRRQRRSRDRRAQRSARRARDARAVLLGDQLVEPYNIGDIRKEDEHKVCEYCNALLFKDEPEQICCKKGKVQVEKLPESPPRLKALLEGTDLKSKTMRKYAREINTALSFASLTTQLKDPPWSRGGRNPNIVIQGKSYYNLGSVQANPGVTPRNAQVSLRDTALFISFIEVKYLLMCFTFRSGSMTRSTMAPNSKSAAGDCFSSSLKTQANLSCRDSTKYCRTCRTSTIRSIRTSAYTVTYERYNISTTRSSSRLARKTCLPTRRAATPPTTHQRWPCWSTTSLAAGT